MTAGVLPADEQPHLLQADLVRELAADEGAAIRLDDPVGASVRQRERPGPQVGYPRLRFEGPRAAGISNAQDEQLRCGGARVQLVQLDDELRVSRGSGPPPCRPVLPDVRDE